MNHNIEFVSNYFTEEKIENLFFIIIGLISIALSFIFWFIIKYSFYNGMAFSLFTFGLFQLIVGTTVIVDSNMKSERMTYFVLNQQGNIKQKELPNVELGIKKLIIYKYAELLFIVFGLILFLRSKQTNHVFWKGLGLGLIIQLSLMLCLNFVTALRLENYKFAILNFLQA